MSTSRRTIAIKSLLLALALLATAWGQAARAAEVVAAVVNLSGPLLAKKADGSVKALAQKSAVEQGDTLVTEKNTYARLRFVDNSEITLRPDSQLKIDNFSFDADKPDKDSAVFSLVKGGLRAVTGLLGKRNHERVGVNTPTATIGIRGTTFIAQYVPPPAGPNPTMDTDLMRDRLITVPTGQEPDRKGSNGGAFVSSASPVLSPGLHLQVTDGAIVVTNNGGSQGFQAGQFGYVPNMNQPPVIVPSNPGIQFTPPPAFNTGSTNGAGDSGKKGPADCVVR